MSRSNDIPPAPIKNFLSLQNNMLTHFFFTGTQETQISFNQKNTFKGHGTEEESHFFFYFGFMTVLTMIFYLILYHKKKVR